MEKLLHREEDPRESLTCPALIEELRIPMKKATYELIRFRQCHLIKVALFIGIRNSESARD